MVVIIPEKPDKVEKGGIARELDFRSATRNPNIEYYIVLDRSLKKAVDHVNSTRETCPFNSISEKAGLTLNLCDHNNSVVA